MSQAQWIAQVQQEEWLYEAEARRIEDANAELQEIVAGRDAEFMAAMLAKFPELRAWPGKGQK
jgi:hypothetical protein